MRLLKVFTLGLNQVEICFQSRPAAMKSPIAHAGHERLRPAFQADAIARGKQRRTDRSAATETMSQAGRETR